MRTFEPQAQTKSQEPQLLLRDRVHSRVPLAEQPSRAFAWPSKWDNKGNSKWLRQAARSRKGMACMHWHRSATRDRGSRRQHPERKDGAEQPPSVTALRRRRQTLLSAGRGRCGETYRGRMQPFVRSHLPIFRVTIRCHIASCACRPSTSTACNKRGHIPSVGSPRSPGERTEIAQQNAAMRYVRTENGWKTSVKTAHRINVRKGSRNRKYCNVWSKITELRPRAKRCRAAPRQPAQERAKVRPNTTIPVTKSALSLPSHFGMHSELRCGAKWGRAALRQPAQERAKKHPKRH